MLEYADFIGRFDSTDPGGPQVDFPGVRIRLRFKGRELGVRTSELLRDDTHGSRYALRLDGRIGLPVFAPRRGVTEQVLVSGLDDAVHELEIFRRTEPQYGRTQWQAFDLPGGTWLPPPPRSDRRILVFGDSMCNGYGVEGRRDVDRGSAGNQNAALSCPEFLAQALGAEVHNCSVSNIYMLNPKDVDQADWNEIFPRSLAWIDTSCWNAGLYQPQVIVVAVGNDWAQPDPDVFDPPAAEEYIPRYERFITQVRAAYPAAHVACVMSPAVWDSWPAGYQAYTCQRLCVTTVVERLRQRGDRRLHYVEFTRCTDADLSACEGHPGVKLARDMAAQLAIFSRAWMGW